jgi:hypothetical protein
MNIVNYIRFSQDPRNGAQQQTPKPPEDENEYEPEDASPPVEEQTAVVQPVVVPDYTTNDWLQRFAKLVD